MNLGLTYVKVVLHICKNMFKVKVFIVTFVVDQHNWLSCCTIVQKIFVVV